MEHRDRSGQLSVQTGDLRLLPRAGWIETGNDPVGHADITMSPEGYPQWVIAYEPHQDPDRPVPDPAAPLLPNQIDR